MSVADLLVLLLIVSLLASAGYKLYRDRRRARAAGGEMLPVCVGCPIAAQCRKENASCADHHKQKPVASSFSCH